jgi:hypothetical protein
MGDGLKIAAATKWTLDLQLTQLDHINSWIFSASKERVFWPLVFQKGRAWGRRVDFSRSLIGTLARVRVANGSNGPVSSWIDSVNHQSSGTVLCLENDVEQFLTISCCRLLDFNTGLFFALLLWFLLEVAAKFCQNLRIGIMFNKK